MSPLDPSNRPENWNLVEDKDFKVTFMNMIEVLKEEMDKPHKEIYNYTNSGRKWTKQFKT